MSDRVQVYGLSCRFLLERACCEQNVFAPVEAQMLATPNQLYSGAMLIACPMVTTGRAPVSWAAISLVARALREIG